MVIEFARHGAREPIYDYFNSTPFDSKGELTPVGMRQHYLLGQTLRKLYVEKEELLSENYDSKEIYVYSTNYNRTILSAMSQLYGLYPLETGPIIEDSIEKKYLNPPFETNNSDFNEYCDKINNELGNSALFNKFQPIPVHVNALNRDSLLRPFDLSVCPGNLNFINGQYSSNTYKELNEIFKENTFKEISKLMGIPLNEVDLWLAFDVYDVYENFRYANLSFPINFSPELMKNLTFIHDIMIYFVYFGSEIQRRVLNTPIFNEILRYFDGKIQGREEKKFVYYSGHDRTVSMILSGLNYSSFLCAYNKFMGFEDSQSNQSDICLKFPHYAANLLIELHESENKNTYVKIRYNGNYLPMCGYNNSTSCDYNIFWKKIKNFVVADFAKECKKESEFRNITNETVDNGSERESVTKVFAFLFGLVLGSSVVFAIFYYKYVKKEREHERESDYYGFQ